MTPHSHLDMGAVQGPPAQACFAQAHLTEDQLDEMLLEIAEPEVAAHAGSCAPCSQRLQQFRQAVGMFNQASMAWSEARSNALPRPVAAEINAGRATLWSYATVSILAAALLTTAAVHHHAVETSGGSQLASAPASNYFASRQQEIATDNAMLSAISSELYRPLPIPAALADNALTVDALAVDGKGPRTAGIRQDRN